jgi:hypothetical protein
MVCVVCELASMKQQLQLPRMLVEGIRLVSIAQLGPRPRPA